MMTTQQQETLKIAQMVMIYLTQITSLCISHESQYSKAVLISEIERIVHEYRSTSNKHENIIIQTNNRFNSLLRFDMYEYTDLYELESIFLEIEIRLKLKIRMEKSRGKNGTDWFNLKTITITY